MHEFSLASILSRWDRRPELTAIAWAEVACWESNAEALVPREIGLHVRYRWQLTAHAEAAE